jgi:hypothetical protein
MKTYKYLLILAMLPLLNIAAKAQSVQTKQSLVIPWKLTAKK